MEIIRVMELECSKRVRIYHDEDLDNNIAGLINTDRPLSKTRRKQLTRKIAMVMREAGIKSLTYMRKTD